MSSEITSFITFVESYLTWLSSMPGKLLTVIPLIAFAVLSALELSHPQRWLSLKQVRKSYQTNIGLFLFNSAVVSLLSAAPLLIAAEYAAGRGLLRAIDSPSGKALLSFVLLDLLLYGWHRLSHQVDGLWRFHQVHHSDPFLNVSTAFRLHIVELLILTGLKSAYIVLLGVDKAMVVMNEALLTLFILFHHTNIAFRCERQAGKILIVPYLHRMHHSIERSEHDSNYGAVLSIWDRLFGTLIEKEPKAIGIKARSPQTVFGLVRFGFAPAQPAPVCAPVALDAMIAEAAYYKAEQRAFKPGNELRDWLEAKREIIRMVYGDQANGPQENQSRRPSMQRTTLC